MQLILAPPLSASETDLAPLERFIHQWLGSCEQAFGTQTDHCYSVVVNPTSNISRQAISTLNIPEVEYLKNIEDIYYEYQLLKF